MVDENSPDWPTNTETAHDSFEYSGGLNGPKSTGQTTVPVIASQDERQHSYAAEEEDAIRRMMEMAGIKTEAKKVEEDDVEEGNKFTGNLAKARADGKKEADLDGDGDMEKVRESVAGLWKEYKGKHGV
jgi:metal-dependent hydrolase (beta-lactamase superfamily II)